MDNIKKFIFLTFILILISLVHATGIGIGNSSILYYWTLDQTYDPKIGTATGLPGIGTPVFTEKLFNYSLNQDYIGGNYGINTTLKDNLFTNDFCICSLVSLTGNVEGYIISKHEANTNSRTAFLGVDINGYPMFMTSNTGLKIAGNNVSQLTAYHNECL